MGCFPFASAYPLKHTERMAKRPKRSRDPNQLGKLIVDLATGQAENPKDTRNRAAVALGALGAKKGGKARAAKLTSAQRKAIAKKAAAARWGKSPT